MIFHFIFVPLVLLLIVSSHLPRGSKSSFGRFDYIDTCYESKTKRQQVNFPAHPRLALRRASNQCPSRPRPSAGDGPAAPVTTTTVDPPPAEAGAAAADRLPRSSSYRRLSDDPDDGVDPDDDLYHDDQELARSVGIPLHVSTPIRPLGQMAQMQEPSPMRSLASADDPFAGINTNGSAVGGGGAGAAAAAADPFANAASSSSFPPNPNNASANNASMAASSGGAGAFGSSGTGAGGNTSMDGFHTGTGARRPNARPNPKVNVNETIDAITASWDARAGEDDAEADAAAARRRIEEMLNSSKDSGRSSYSSHPSHPSRRSSTGSGRGRSPARSPNAAIVGNGSSTGTAAARTTSALIGTPTHMEILNGAPPRRLSPTAALPTPALAMATASWPMTGFWKAPSQAAAAVP